MITDINQVTNDQIVQFTNALAAGLTTYAITADNIFVISAKQFDPLTGQLLPTMVNMVAIPVGDIKAEPLNSQNYSAERATLLEAFITAHGL